MTEAELTREITGVAGDVGLLWHHCRDSRRCQGRRGFPDVIAAGPGGLLAAEIKLPDGENSAGQDLWAWTLERASGGSLLWCPSWQPADLASGEVRRRLEQIR